MSKLDIGDGGNLYLFEDQSLDALYDLQQRFPFFSYLRTEIAKKELELNTQGSKSKVLAALHATNLSSHSLLLYGAQIKKTHQEIDTEPSNQKIDNTKEEIAAFNFVPQEGFEQDIPSLAIEENTPHQKTDEMEIMNESIIQQDTDVQADDISEANESDDLESIPKLDQPSVKNKYTNINSPHTKVVKEPLLQNELSSYSHWLLDMSLSSSLKVDTSSIDEEATSASDEESDINENAAYIPSLYREDAIESVEPAKPTLDKNIIEKDNIISETYAKILAEQGYTERAINMYKKLVLLFPEKKRYFADLIEKLQ